MRRSLLALVVAPLLLTACDTNSDRPPRRAIITAVQIDDAPLRAPDGSQWDGSGGGGPEIYFRLFFADTDETTRPGDDVLNPRDDTFVLNQTQPGQPWVSNVQGADFPLVWAIDGGFEVRNLNDQYKVVLYDYDDVFGGDDDRMIGTRTFTFAEQAPDVADGREDTIILDGTGADQNLIRVRLRVRYEY